MLCPLVPNVQGSGPNWMHLDFVTCQGDVHIQIDSDAEKDKYTRRAGLSYVFYF